MPATFYFVDSSHHDRRSKRLARSHAMRGKNAGKKIHRRSRLDLEAQRSKLKDQTCGALERCEASPDPAFISLQPSLHAELECIPFPVSCTPENRYVINRFFAVVSDALHPPQLCRQSECMGVYWLQFLFETRLSFHSTFAMMATMSLFFFDNDSLQTDIHYHLSQAIRLVNEQVQTLSFNQATLAVVNFLIVQGLAQDDLSQATTHRNGLQQILRVMGGLSQLELHRTLLIKIYKTDLDYALHNGTPTYFYRDQMVSVKSSLAAQGYIWMPESPDLERNLGESDPELWRILQDLDWITSLYNKDNSTFKVDPHMLSEIIVSVGCRLLRYRTLNDPGLENFTDAAIHVGTAAFLTTLYVQFSSRWYLKYRLIGTHLRETIERRTNNQHPEVTLWLLFLGGISVLADSDPVWLNQRLEQVMQQLDLCTWDEIHGCLLHFPWIKVLHDEPAKTLWSFVRTNQPADISRFGGGS